MEKTEYIINAEHIDIPNQKKWAMTQYQVWRLDGLDALLPVVIEKHAESMIVFDLKGGWVYFLDANCVCLAPIVHVDNHGEGLVDVVASVCGPEFHRLRTKNLSAAFNAVLLNLVSFHSESTRWIRRTLILRSLP